MENRRLELACAAAASRERKGIGTLSETGIHNALKYYFEPDGSCHEISVGGYVADIVGEDGIIEIQNGHFSAMKEKLAAFLEHSPVTVVYPCVIEKRITLIDPDTGEVISRRKSPKKGKIYDIVRELWSIAGLLESERLSICVFMLNAEEIRERCEPTRGRGRRRRLKNYRPLDKLPAGYVGEIWLRSPEDHRKLLPGGLPEEFTTRDLREAAGIDAFCASSMVNLMTGLGQLERVGKRGNAYLYRLTETGGGIDAQDGIQQK